MSTNFIETQLPNNYQFQSHWTLTNYIAKPYTTIFTHRASHRSRYLLLCKRILLLCVLLLFAMKKQTYRCLYSRMFCWQVCLYDLGYNINVKPDATWCWTVCCRRHLRSIDIRQAVLACHGAANNLPTYLVKWPSVAVMRHICIWDACANVYIYTKMVDKHLGLFIVIARRRVLNTHIIIYI